MYSNKTDAVSETFHEMDIEQLSHVAPSKVTEPPDMEAKSNALSVVEEDLTNRRIRGIGNMLVQKRIELLKKRKHRVLSAVKY